MKSQFILTMVSFNVDQPLLKSRVSQISLSRSSVAATKENEECSGSRSGGQTRRSLIFAVFAALFFGLFMGNLYQGALLDSTRPMIRLRLVCLRLNQKTQLKLWCLLKYYYY